MYPSPLARPLAALIATCLMASPLASAQAAAQQTPDAPSAIPAKAATFQPDAGPNAVAPASTAEALSSEVVGKTFFLRGFYQGDKLEFATDGKPVGSLQKGSFALSGMEIDKVKFTKHSMQIEGHRIGLHFFGALPYEDDSKPYEKIKVDPKKTVEIEVTRLDIEPEKKKKKKEKEKEEAKKEEAKKEMAAKAAPPGTDASLPSAPEAPAAKPEVPPAPAAPAVAATAAGVPPEVSPEHDPRISFLQLSKALNTIFAPSLNDSVIATLPAYWQNYFATKEGRVRAARVDASAMRPGGDVKPPQLLTRIDPASNDYAQKNNIAGMVFLRVIVDAQGRPGEVTIVRPIGFGLDEMAVDAVQHSQFRAGTMNGKPVPELVNLQVTFRIYSNRTRPTGMPAVPTQVAPRESPKMPPSNAPIVADAGTVNE